MTLPPDSPTSSDAASMPRLRMALAVATLLMALKAFALGASGSISALAGLAESGLVMVGIAMSAFAARWRTTLPDVSEATADAMGLVFQSGLAVASALFIGVIALFGIFEPRPVGEGPWAFAAVAIALGIGLAIVALNGRGRLDTGPVFSSYADLVPGFVVLIGVWAGSMLNAPGLDAAAALVVAVWLLWGALAPISEAAGLLSQD